MSRQLLFTAFLILVFSSSLQADLRLEVRAGGHDRENCPVVLPLPEDMADTASFTLVREGDNTPIPIQRFGQRNSPKLMWMIHDRLKAGDHRRYRLAANSGRPRLPKTVRCDDDGAKLTLSVDGSPVLRFNHATVQAPPGIDAVYRRSGYIHPVLTPQGNIVTGDFEKDHAHQHGIFNALVNASFRDKPVDFWNQAKGKGDVEFAQFVNRKISGPVFAQFTAKLNHIAIDGDQTTPAINETWQVRVYNSRQPFLFEIFSRQTTATNDAIQANEYHYGGFGIRGPSEWLLNKVKENSADAIVDSSENEDPPAEGGFLTSSGRTREDGNHTRARWVEMHGPIGTQHAGIIVLGAQGNFRAPQTVRLHPNKPYFCFAPMVLGEFSISPRQVYAARYRFVVHDGDHDAALAERMWQDLAHPPKVTALRDR